MKARHSTAPTFAISSRDSRPKLGKRIRRWLICLARSQNARRQPRLRSHSRGCSRRNHGSFRFRARRNSIGWKRTLEQHQSNLRRIIFAKSKPLHPKFKCKELATPSTLSKRPDGEGGYEKPAAERVLKLM